ncbi:UDP-N-acetylmuramoyl-tripeptide--D-alanyl-D-alanine ligase [Bacteroidota bacterium]
MLSNTAEFNKVEITVNFGESSAQKLPNDWTCRGVRVDSRAITDGNLFIALKGENTDGHNFVDMAFESGASAAVVNQHWYRDNIEKYKDKHVIIVKDTLKALGRLANLHRRRFDIPIVAIGGANGKTTTKDMMASVLAQKFNILKTYKNYNNQIGMPFMLLQLDESHQAAVLEIGTNEPGEIAILSEMLEPTHGLITNIGKEHLEKLIDLDGVEMEETFLFGFLHKTNGVSFINMDDERLSKYQVIMENEFTYGTSNDEAMIIADISLNKELNPLLTIRADERELKVQLSTIGYASGLNALAAASVGFHFGLSEDEIKSGLESYKSAIGDGYGRMVFEDMGSYKVLNDCYNANPDSMKMAFHTLKAVRSSGRKIAVLGDMRELGEYALEEHKTVIQMAVEISDLIYVFGKEMNKALRDFNRKDMINSYITKDDLLQDLIQQIEDGDTILIKGSRGMAMEKIITGLKKQTV